MISSGFDSIAPFKSGYVGCTQRKLFKLVERGTVCDHINKNISAPIQVIQGLDHQFYEQYDEILKKIQCFTYFGIMFEMESQTTFIFIVSKNQLRNLSFLEHTNVIRLSTTLGVPPNYPNFQQSTNSRQLGGWVHCEK